jgi:hypothetical protein
MLRVMVCLNQIPEPFQFNPLKHHLVFIKEFVSHRIDPKSGTEIQRLSKELKRIGTSVMDIYNGLLSTSDICKELSVYLEINQLLDEEIFSSWTGKKFDDFRVIELSDSSRWILKYHKDPQRFVHFFPARSSPYTFRVKANTLKSSMLYFILIGKDYISGDDLNKARGLIGLSPVKNTIEAEAITTMIEILRQ